LTSGVPSPAALVNAETQNDFKGEGKTDRKGSLKGKISAMVAEVLPSGVLRIEGEKIISVNSEQQVMVISGLVRPRDINSENEIDSSKIAQLRIDYYGEGTVGEAQNGGWLGRFMRKVWPF
jgi:flagellar L-ring protein precursor FlgH